MKKIRRIAKVAVLALLVTALFVPVQFAYADETVSVEKTPFSYEHDPRLNAKTMEDVVVNPDAIYGYSPDPNSVRLGEYASYDWTDPKVVAKATKDRIEYLEQFNEMYILWKDLEAKGKGIEEIARAVSKRRNEIRLESYKDDPVGLAKVKKSNFDKYGNEEGPTAISLFEKYGSWEKVLEKSFASNSGMDACLGLYDIEYELNVATGEIKESYPVKYTVKKNDSLAKIAKKYYGNSAYWMFIYNENKDIIKNPNTILEGWTIIVPLR